MPSWNGIFFGGVKSGHKVSDCHILKSQCKESNQAQESGPTLDAPKKNHFNALRSKGDLEDSPDVCCNILN